MNASSALAAVSVDNAAVLLPALIDRAAAALANARSAAEVLDAREKARLLADMAKRTARMAKAKQAHDDLIAAAYRAKGHALQIEARANIRFADEYDAAQERGEIAKAGNPNFSQTEKLPRPDIPPKEMHEARMIRDAEQASPGIVRRTVDEALAAGEEPTKAKVRRAVLTVVKPDEEARPKRGRDAICDRVRQAIAALSGLPPAAEVAEYFRGTDGALVVADHLPAAVQWLMEFSDAWEKVNAGPRN